MFGERSTPSDRPNRLERTGPKTIFDLGIAFGFFGCFRFGGFGFYGLECLDVELVFAFEAFKHFATFERFFTHDVATFWAFCRGWKD